MAEARDTASAALAALTQYFVDEETLGQTLERVSQLACQAAPADMAGITLLVEGRPRTGVFTDPEAPTIDEAQYATGQGPCLDAFEHGVVNRIDDTATDARWPEFCATCVAHGVRSTLSLPVAARGTPVAALNLYSRRLSAFDEATVERTMAFAGHAAVVLANAQVYWDARSLGENLQRAMASRAVIDCAIGIIMATGNQSRDDAFEVLVRASQRENRKLRDIANDMVAATEQRAVAPPGAPAPS